MFNFNLAGLMPVLLEATTVAAPTKGESISSMIITLLFPILMIVLMWLFLIRPQRKEEKQRQADRDAMKVGDNVVTIGGIVGRVVNIKDDEVTITTSVSNTMMTFRKAAIDKVIKPISDDE